MTRRLQSRCIVPAVVLLAAVLRLLYFQDIRTRPDFSHPGLDAGYHDYWARGLAFGQWTPPPDQADPQIRTQPYFRPPGYPYFLAVVYRVTGGGPSAARLAQFALGLLNVLLALWCTRRWFGDVTAWVVGLLTGTYWVFIYYEGELLEPVLLTTLTWLLLLALERWAEGGKARWLFGAGLALGLSALVRPNALIWLPAVAAWVVWRKSGGKAVAVLAAGAAIAILPVTARNYVAGGDLVLISSNGGINLLLGQNPEAVANHASGETGNWSCFDWPALVARASAEAGRQLKASEASRWFGRKAREQIFGRPRFTLKLLVLKTLLFWGPREVANNKVEELERTASPVLRRLPVSFSFVLAWCVVGCLLAWRNRRETAPTLVLLLLLIASSFVSFLPFIAAGQYRAPLTPLLMVLASVGLVETSRYAGQGNTRAAAGWVAAGLALWWLLGINYTGYRPNEARWFLARGISLERAGDLMAAEAEYREVLRVKPGLDVANNRLGVVLARQERYEEALKCFEAAVAVRPDFVDAQANLGLTLALLNRVAEAIPHFEAVLREQPGHADARHNLEQARKILESAKP